VDGLAGSETGIGAITNRIRSLSKQDEDLIVSNEILTQEYETESHRLSLMTCNRCFSIYLLKFI
jgi:hypothetical protein